VYHPCFVCSCSTPPVTATTNGKLIGCRLVLGFCFCFVFIVRKKESFQLPKKGPKFTSEDPVAVKENSLKERLESLQTVQLLPQRQPPRKTVCMAEWDSSKSKAAITQAKGSHFEVMGHNEGATVYLHVEEAVFVP
jgi:hypothetical protein